MISRPSFTGELKAGAKYVLVDDVTVIGAILAGMANYIRGNGGEFVYFVTLVNSGLSCKMAAEEHCVAEIERRFGDVV